MLYLENPDCFSFQLESTANFFLDELDSALTREKKAYVGIVGGRTLDVFYAELASRWRSDLARVEFFLADERVTDVIDDRNSSHLQKIFFEPLFFRTRIKASVYVPKAPGPFPFPRCDLLLLSVGEDGHIASLFPESPALTSPERSYLQVLNSPKLPAHRLTIGPQVIRESRCSMLFFLGAEKEAAFGRLSDPSLLLDNCPAKLGLVRDFSDQKRSVFYSF